MSPEEAMADAMAREIARRYPGVDVWESGPGGPFPSPRPSLIGGLNSTRKGGRIEVRISLDELARAALDAIAP